MTHLSIDRPEVAAEGLNAEFRNLAVPDRLKLLRGALGGRIVFTTSLGLEDQVLTYFIAASGLNVELVTLDTGRLFSETYSLWAQTEDRFGLRIRAVYPDHLATENLIAKQGVNGFYHSIDRRKACCGVRKVEPLGRALGGAEGWLTGLRADQSDDRQTLPFVSFEPSRGVLKANPLLDWTREQAVDFSREKNIPLNPLHDQGFLSIGCAPCTRAVQPGESERAGRWWWELEAKECGLHVDPDGKLVRSAAQSPSGDFA